MGQMVPALPFGRSWGQLVDVLTPTVGRLLSELIVESSLKICGLRSRAGERPDPDVILDEVERRLRLFVHDPEKRGESVNATARFRGRAGSPAPAPRRAEELDVVLLGIISRHTVPAVASIIVSLACRAVRRRMCDLKWEDLLLIQPHLERLVMENLRQETRREACLRDLDALIWRGATGPEPPAAGI